MNTSIATHPVSFALFGMNDNSGTKPFEIIQMYIDNCNCENIIRKRDGHAELDRIVKSEMKVHFKAVEIKHYDKVYSICKDADGYIAFADLERKTSLDCLDEIIEYIKENCLLDKKTYILGYYANEETKLDSMNDDEMNRYLNSKKILHDYMELCINQPSEVVKTIDFIILESLEIKNRQLKSKIHIEEPIKDRSDGCRIY